MTNSGTNYSPRNSQLALRFGLGEPAGFTSVGVASFQNLNPAAVVRELIQNSLDAAREAKRNVARVRFETREHPLSAIPGIRDYRVAFNEAVRAQRNLKKGGLSAQADLVVQAINRTLSARSCETLFVLDNGIGLNADRMNGLLGDGFSIKDDSGAGAFGNGHYVVVPASDLRYILYGGRSIDGSLICAGHAILASHQTRGEVRGKDGYFVRGFYADKLLDRYIFATEEEVPGFLAERLQWIKRNWEPGAGTVVAVPSFNAFSIRGETLWDLIAKPAACNFFPAFANNELCVEIVEKGHVKRLDRSSISDTLESVSGQKRYKNFLSGSKAMSALETIQWDTQKIVVQTEIGSVPIWIRELKDGGISRIDLCRSGMWISENIPKLRRQSFANLKPFHCVLQIDSSCGEIHGLIRKSEGPLHNHLEAHKRLSKPERIRLDNALKKVAEAIRKTVDKLSTERVPVEDVLNIKDFGIGFGGRRSAREGQFAEMREYRRKIHKEEEESEDGRQAGDSEGKGNGNGGGGVRLRPAGRPIRFQAIAVPVRLRSCRVEIKPEEGFDAAEVRFGIDESVDASCDILRGEALARLERVRVCWREIDPSMLTKNEAGDCVGILLGKCQAHSTWPIEFDFRLPEEIQLPDNCRVVLKTRLFRRSRKGIQPGAGIVEQRVQQ